MDETNFWKELLDDKIVAIICIAFLTLVGGVGTLICGHDPTAIVAPGVTAIAALAVGKPVVSK